MAQTESFALAGPLSFACLPLYLSGETSSLRPGGEGRIASLGVCRWLGFQFISPDIAEGFPFNLDEEYDYLVCLQLLHWWLGSVSLDCLPNCSFVSLVLRSQTSLLLPYHFQSFSLVASCVIFMVYSCVW